MTVPNLFGMHILVVEDEPLLSLDICAQIEENGGSVIGPAATLARGHALLRDQRPDGAILNIRIGDEVIYPLADEVLHAGIPVVFASSEARSAIPERYAAVPLLGKPLDMIVAIEKLFEEKRGS